MLRCCCAVVFILLRLICIGQSTPDKTIQFNHFSSDHGLSRNHFESIVQDKKGYMWFGTRNGLIKFDGYIFTTYQFDPNSKNSLPDNFVWRLCDGNEGNIWMVDGDSN